MGQYFDLIQTASSVISAVAIVIVLLQFRQQQKIWFASHERSRREKAIDIIREFNKSMNAESAATYKIVEELDDRQCRDLDEGKPIRINATLENELRAALPNQPLTFNDGYFDLDSSQSYKLRFQALEIMNAAEIACQAWLRDVADRSIIEDELQFLYQRKKSRPTTMMERFRALTDGQIHYPALTEFLNHMDALAHPSPVPPDYIAPPPNPPKKLK